MQKQKILFLVGPTAAGKSEIAGFVVRKINAEIISCDSMQIYKGMDIITSKPSRSLRRKARHHLIDVLSLTKEYNVSNYRKDAIKIIRDIYKRGKVPFFVGGTGLYMAVLIDGIFEVKAKSNALRKKLFKQAQSKAKDYLYNRLSKVDPQAAAKIHPNDLKRIIRAIEVFEITGKPISTLQKQRTGLSKEYDVVIFGLNMDRDELYRRIDERVDKMFKRGLVSEANKLLRQCLSKTASSAIGIRELRGYFNGEYDLNEAKRLIQKNTRNYAKRQLTWFRKDKRINWIEVKTNDKPESIARKIAREFHGKSFISHN